jgi:hypothetical protein
LKGRGIILAKLVMERQAADNKYLHRDFHVSTDIALQYIGNNFGSEGVREFLEQFAKAWYSPLARAVHKEGLSALKTYIEKIYEEEAASEVLHTRLTGNDLLVSIDKCPAVTYMRSTGHIPSRWYVELTATVNRIIADMAGLGFEMISYEDAGGRAVYRFYGPPGTLSSGTADVEGGQ